MNFISNQNKISLRSTDLTNSLIFYLYYKNQNKYTKSVNSIKAFYLDPILKDHIYVASNGLKKNIIFRRPECNENILHNNVNSFVSYFHTLEDNLFKFNIYPSKYFKDLTINYLKTQQIVLKVKRKLTPTDQKKFKSKFFKNYLLFSTLKKNPIFGDFSKITLIKSMYLKLYFLTNRGFVKNLSNRFSDRIFFTGLNYIFKEYIKETFRYILVLNYILLNFFSNIILTQQKNSNLLYNIIIYYNFWKFLNFKFFDYLKEKKLRFRKSNILLRKYKNLINSRFTKIIKLYYFLALKYYTLNLTTTNWLKNLIFNTNNFLFNNNNDEIANNRLLNKITSLSIEERLNSFKFLVNFIQYNIFVNNLNYNSKFKLFHKYIYLKSIFAQTLLKRASLKLTLFFEKNLSFYLYDLFFFKVNQISNVIYPKEQHTFLQITLNWYSNFKKEKNSLQFFQKRRFNPLLGLSTEKVVSITKIKPKKLTKINSLGITSFLQKFDNLKNRNIKTYKVKTILKIKKNFRYKKITSTEKIKKIQFTNHIINSLLTLKRKRTLNLPEFNRLRVMIK